MREESLTDLLCPAQDSNISCHGVLALEGNAAAPVPVIRSGQDPREVLEGLVICQKCHEWYPIIAGVLVLVNNVRTYLASEFSVITNAAAASVSRELLNYIYERGYDLHDVGYSRSLWGNALGMELYISAHYDNMVDIAGPDHPLTEVLRAYGQRDFYTRVVDMASEALTAQGRALDIGCNVGGIAAKFAKRCQFVYGIDYSFRAALTARRILLHQPEAQRQYRLYREGLKYDIRDLPDVKRDNVEILVASGLNLPFADMSFDLAYCANVTDLVGQPAEIVREAQRVLNTSGSVLLTDPYYWRHEDTPLENWFGARSGQYSAVALRELLAQTCKIMASEERMLWILRAYDRYMTIWLADCILARKRTQEGDASIDY
jgi:SAM-dependent methyltransferase